MTLGERCDRFNATWAAMRRFFAWFALALACASCAGAAATGAYGATQTACLAVQEDIVNDANPCNATESETSFDCTVRTCKLVLTKIREACGEACE